MWVPDPAHRATHDTRHRSLFILQFGCNLLIFQDASRPRFTAKPLIGLDERQPLNQRVPGSSPGAPTIATLGAACPGARTYGRELSRNVHFEGRSGRGLRYGFGYLGHR
jgi:hypothetical protein